MFRLVKVLNGNNQYEAVTLKVNPSSTYGKGSALICQNGVLNSPTNTALPEFVSLCDKEDEKNGMIQAMIVTQDMLFKIEYTGSTTPTVGMTVALSTHKNKMDGVTYNSSGKGTVVAIDDDKKMVYVRFRK